MGREGRVVAPGHAVGRDEEADGRGDDGRGVVAGARAGARGRDAEIDVSDLDVPGGLVGDERRRRRRPKPKLNMNGRVVGGQRSRF